MSAMQRALDAIERDGRERHAAWLERKAKEPVKPEVDDDADLDAITRGLVGVVDGIAWPFKREPPPRPIKRKPYRPAGAACFPDSLTPEGPSKKE